MGKNMGQKLVSLIVVGTLFSFISSSANAFKIEDVNFDTLFGVQNRTYDNNAIAPAVQRRHEFATLYFQQEMSYRWNNGRDSLVVTPYFSGTRYEDPWKLEHDGWIPFIVPIPIIDFGDTRTRHAAHADLREFMWTTIAPSNKWELRTGVGKVFWGVTESQHLVDVINQDDLLTDIDGEDKLGQPMINLTLVKNWGNLDFFILPGFRERVYQENYGRLAPVLKSDYSTATSILNPSTMINRDEADWESNAEDLHTDFAFRWSHNIGVSDIGLSYFLGTNRDPVLGLINEDLATPTVLIPSATSTNYLITPYYEQMTQLGLDYQATVGAWLLKLEAIYRESDSLKTYAKDLADGKTSDFTTDYAAATAGYEYTFTGIFGTKADLGLIMEYSWDGRDFEATTSNQNDLFVGMRFAKNSTADAALLFGIIQDLDFDSYVGFFEASRRLGQSNKLIIEGFTGYADEDAGLEIKGIGSDPTAAIANEDHVRIAWETYF